MIDPTIFLTSSYASMIAALCAGITAALMHHVWPKFGLGRLTGILVFTAFVYHILLPLDLGLPLLFEVEAMNELYMTEVMYSFLFTMMCVSLPLLAAGLDRFMNKTATLAAKKIDPSKDLK